MSACFPMRTTFICFSAALAFALAACTPKKDPEPPKPKVDAAKTTSVPAPAAAGLAATAAPIAPTTSAASTAPTASAVAALPAIGPAPAWQLKDVNGKLVTSDQFKGKVVVLDFWATW